MNSTMASFVLHALGATPFDALFQLDDTALAARQMARVTANATAGFPCRVSLVDADVGDELLLLSYLHQPADSPYRASGPIFVKRGARRAALAPDEVPAQVQRRLMSLRAYNAADRIVAAEICDGRYVADWLQHAFDDAAIAYVHLHFARYGCYACRAERAPGVVAVG